MFRSKIIGQKHFNLAAIMPPVNTNYDRGNFSIGTAELTTTAFEDIPIPHKYLWIRAKVDFDMCPAIPVIQGSNSFVFNCENFEKVKIQAVHLLYAQKDYEIDKCWRLSDQQPIFTQQFAVAPTIYSHADGIHLWPCGAKAGDFLNAQQQYAQLASDSQNLYMNNLNTWKSHLKDVDEIVFEPPAPPLPKAINQFIAHIEQDWIQYSFFGCKIEATDSPEFIDILCERKD